MNKQNTFTGFGKWDEPPLECLYCGAKEDMIWRAKLENNRICQPCYRTRLIASAYWWGLLRLLKVSNMILYSTRSLG